MIVARLSSRAFAVATIVARTVCSAVCAASLRDRSERHCRPTTTRATASATSALGAIQAQPPVTAARAVPAARKPCGATVAVATPPRRIASGLSP